MTSPFIIWRKENMLKKIDTVEQFEDLLKQEDQIFSIKT